jgi:hypothetical protein
MVWSCMMTPQMNSATPVVVNSISRYVRRACSVDWILSVSNPFVRVGSSDVAQCRALTPWGNGYMLSPEPEWKMCFINDLADTNPWLEELCVGSWMSSKQGSQVPIGRQLAACG